MILKNKTFLVLKERFYPKLLSSLKTNFRLWLKFIISLIKTKNNFAIMSVEGWHLGNYYEDRLKTYKKLFERDNQINVIEVNLQSKYMLVLLILYLRINKNLKYKFDKKNFKHSKDFDYKEIYKKSLWDINLKYFYKNKNLKNLFNSDQPVDYKIYKSLYNKFNPKVNRSHLKNLTKIFNCENLEMVIISQESYEEWSYSCLALKYSKKLVVLESKIGLLAYTNINNDLNYLIGNYQKSISQNITHDEMKNAEQNLTQRVQGNYVSKNMFYMKKIDKSEVYKIKNYKEKPILLFLHAFADAPNRKILNSKLTSFIDFYDISLFVIEYCIKNKVPLYIKPHPNREDYVSDKVFTDNLKKLLEHKKKLNKDFYYEWIDGFFPSINFKNFQMPVAVTGRGSVQVECGFLGIPIATFIKTEQEAFEFSKFLKSKDEFDSFYKNIYENYEINNSKINAIKFEATMEKFESIRIFELDTVSKFTKKYNEPKKYIMELAHFV